MSKSIKLGNFQQDDNNFNKHTEAGMDLLKKSIEKVGVIESITVSSDDKIISGNARQEKISEVLGEDTEPIIIETDGTKPIILKRTDIQSNTKEFHEAALLANTTAKKNINLNMDLIQEIAVEEFSINIVDIGIDTIENIDFSKKNKQLYQSDFENGKYFFKLEYCEDDYQLLIEKIAETNKTKEQIFYDALIQL